MYKEILSYPNPDLILSRMVLVPLLVLALINYCNSPVHTNPNLGNQLPKQN